MNRWHLKALRHRVDTITALNRRRRLLATSDPSFRYELLEELARVARECRHMVTGASPEATRFQELVEALSLASQTERDHATERLLKAIARSEDRGKESLYWQAAALIPV